MLAYERHGSGEPLVLVHGVTHRRQAWYPVLDELAEQREVILVDLPGPRAVARRWSPTAGRVEDVTAREFKEFLADQELDRPHVAGNSLGGLVALVAGAERRRPQRHRVCRRPGSGATSAEFAYTRRFFTRPARSSTGSGRRAERAGPQPRRPPGDVRRAHGAPGPGPADHALGDVRAFAYARPALRTLLAAADAVHRRDPAPTCRSRSPGPPATSCCRRWQAETAKRRCRTPSTSCCAASGTCRCSTTRDMVAQVLLRGSAPVATVAPLEPCRRTPPDARRARARPPDSA